MYTVKTTHCTTFIFKIIIKIILMRVSFQNELALIVEVICVLCKIKIPRFTYYTQCSTCIIVYSTARQAQYMEFSI